MIQVHCSPVLPAVPLQHPRPHSPAVLHTPGEGSLGPHLACIWLPVQLDEGNCSNNNSRLVQGFLALFRDAWLLVLVCGWVLHPSAPGTFHASCEMCSGSSRMTCLWLCIWKKHVASFLQTVGINCETLHCLLLANLAGFRLESLDVEHSWAGEGAGKAEARSAVPLSSLAD